MKISLDQCFSVLYIEPFLKSCNINICRAKLLQSSMRQANNEQNIFTRARRHTSFGMGNGLRGSIGHALLGFLDFTINRKPTLAESQQAIKTNFGKINQIIESVQDHVRIKLQSLEEEVMGIVKDQIQSMKQRTKQTIDKLNKSILEKNGNDELWHLSNEVDYFKAEAFKLFQDNTRLRLEVARLKNQIMECETQLEVDDLTMKKLKKRWMMSKKYISGLLQQPETSRFNDSLVKKIKESQRYNQDSIERQTRKKDNSGLLKLLTLRKQKSAKQSQQKQQPQLKKQSSLIRLQQFSFIKQSQHSSISNGVSQAQSKNIDSIKLKPADSFSIQEDGLITSSNIQKVNQLISIGIQTDLQDQWKKASNSKRSQSEKQIRLSGFVLNKKSDPNRQKIRTSLRFQPAARYQRNQMKSDHNNSLSGILNYSGSNIKHI